MIIKGKTVFIYDVEVFPNFFSVATKNTESGNIKVFQISELQNDIFEIVKIFLNKKIYWCGFNSVHFDAYLTKKRLKSISVKNDLFFSTKFIIILFIILFGLL